MSRNIFLEDTEMKKALSLFVALALVMSAFWLCTTVSASGDVDVTIFSPEFGGRKNFSTDGTWGQVVNLKIGDAAPKTYNANGAVTSAAGVPELESQGAIITSDAGTLRFTTYGNGASMIGVSFWGDGSKNNQALWAEAYEQIVAQHGSAKVDGLSLQYTVTNNGDGVAHLSAEIQIPGVKANSGAPVVTVKNGSTERRCGSNEFIWPGETVTFEYKLEALVEDKDGSMVEDEFLAEDADRGDAGTAVSSSINIVNDSSYDTAGNSLDVTVSPLKIVNTTANAITVNDPAEYIDKPQVDTVKPWRPYRQSGEQPTTTTTTAPVETTTTTTTTTTTVNPEDPYVSTGVYLPANIATWNGGAPEEVEGEGGGTKVEGEGTLTETWTKDSWQYQAYTWDKANKDNVASDAVGIRFKLKINSVGNADVPLRVKFVFQEYWPTKWSTCIKPITAAVGEEAEYVMLLSEFTSDIDAAQFKEMDHQQLRVEALDGATTLGGISFTFSDIEDRQSGEQPTTTTTTAPVETTTTTTTTTTTVNPEDPYVSTGVYLPATATVWNGGSPEEVEGEGGGIKVEGNGTLTETWTKDAWQYQAYTWSQQNVNAITDDTVGLRFKLKVNSVGNADVPLSVKFVLTDYSNWPVCVKPITAAVGEEAEYVMLLSEFGSSGITVSQLKAMNHQQFRVMATDGATALGGISFTFSDIEAIRSNAPTTTTTTTTTTTVVPEGKPGDVNCDGEINLADVRTLVAAIAAGTTNDMTEQAKKNSDVNADTKIDLADVRLLVSAIAGGDFSILK